jgi:import inner membrane translocase subunit TIM23
MLVYIGLGYLIGPEVSSQLWRFRHRKMITLINDKDRQFHEHIKRKRADFSLRSLNNPVPDFYGVYMTLI